MIVIKKNRPPVASRWLNARPGRVIASSFLLVIITGTILLMMPFAAQNRQSVGLLQALFTATSATCVTGLVTVDTATHWSIFGKIVIISLIQIGGLGLVTITSFFYSFVRRKASLKTMVLTQESTASFGFADVMRLVRKIVLITLSIEVTGGIILSAQYIPGEGWLNGLGKGFFQSISSFCNAGFDLTGDTASGPFSSLVGLNHNPAIILTTALLIVIGGLGFVVWSDLINLRKTRKLLFHSKVVLFVSGILILSGTVFFLVTEYTNQSHPYALGSLPAAERPLAALFQAITPRTAGFNSIDQASMHETSKFMTIILMFIGAAPGSTGGGIKVSTFAIVVATIIADLHGRDNIVLFRHRLPRETFTKAFAIIGMAMGLVLACTMILSYIERDALDAGRFHFIDLLFESVSAFATVGLSSAGTPNLQQASWSVLIPVMYIGRVGPAAFAIGLTLKGMSHKEPIHPEGRLLVG